MTLHGGSAYNEDATVTKQ